MIIYDGDCFYDEDTGACSVFPLNIFIEYLGDM